MSVTEKVIGLLPETSIKILRKLRSMIFVLLGPLDFCARLMNGKRTFPPISLRRHSGPLKTLEMSGSEFLAYLKIVADLHDHDRILDIGCGCGMVALCLNEYSRFRGEYFGVDIHKASIRWCQKRIGSKNPRFKFSHIDVKNEQFNPKGMHAAKECRFPFEDGSFDVILLKSVFTHMRPDEVVDYLREIARLLSSGGRCLATFFFLNKEQKECERRGKNRLSFGFGSDIWRYTYKNSPESAIAYSENFIMNVLKQNGLVLKRPVLYGWWSGREEGISYQDIVLVGRAATPRKDAGVERGRRGVDQGRARPSRRL